MSEADQPRRQPGSGIRLGRAFGVPIIVQPVWFLVVVVFSLGFAPTMQDQVPGLSDGGSYAVSLAFVLLLYGSVLVHEISHVAIAKALGMEVRRIVLQLLGGVSEVMEEHPGKPGREYLVAAAGPLTSLLLGGIGLAVVPVFEDGTVAWLLAEQFAWANLLVGGFNALPGLPLDGGRVLRSLLWHVSDDKVRGTIAAAWVGRGLAVCVLGVAVVKPYGFGESTFGALYLVILAVFMWANASLAMTQAKVSGVLPRIDIRSLTRRALPVAAELPLAEAVRRARENGARALVVVDGNGKPNGIVSEAAVSAMPQERQPWVMVSDLSRPIGDGLVLRTDMTGAALVEAVQSTPATEYLVVDKVGAVCGVLARIDLVGALQAAGLR